jgi:SAM-dependent methyltransferase
MELPLHYVIRATNQRIIDPFTPAKLAALGAAIRLRSGWSILDLCCGKGEMLATWSRDHGITGTGVDIGTVNLAEARTRAAELGVADKVTFVHGNARGYVSQTPVDVAACVGATWIGDGLAGTVALLERSLRPGGIMLIGEPFWRTERPGPETAGPEAAGWSQTQENYQTLPGLVGLFGDLGYDLVEMVLADEDSWDRYEASQWLAIRTWLDANPDHELAPEMRTALTEEPLQYVRWGRPLLGWGVFALMKR